MALEIIKAIEVTEASEGRKITTKSFWVNQVLEFNNLVTNITIFLCFEKKKDLELGFEFEFWPQRIRDLASRVRSPWLYLVPP